MSETFRVERTVDDPWVSIHRDNIRDDSLSWAARGIMTFLQSYPEDVLVRRDWIMSCAPDHEEGEAALAELTARGFLGPVE